MITLIWYEHVFHSQNLSLSGTCFIDFAWFCLGQSAGCIFDVKVHTYTRQADLNVIFDFQGGGVKDTRVGRVLRPMRRQCAMVIPEGDKLLA